MRVAIVSRAYADPAVRGKLRALAGHGLAVAALVPNAWRPFSGAPTRPTAFADDSGAQIVPVPVRGTEPDLRWHGPALRRALLEFRPDVIQVEEEPWTRVAATVARVSRRLPSRIVVFGWDSVPRSLPFVSRLRRQRVLRRAAGLVGGTKQALDLLARIRPDVPGTVLPQFGTPAPLAVHRKPHPEFAIGFVGRLVPAKGLDLLFRACVRLTGSWRVHVVGSGPFQEEFERLAERLGIAALITWHGALRREAMERIWPLLDCLAAPSRRTPLWVETRAQAVLDAMAYGLPVVATDSGSLRDVVGRAGYIVPENDIAALTTALQALQDDPAAREQLGTAARRQVLADFADDAVAQRTLAFWTRLTSAASP